MKIIRHILQDIRRGKHLADYFLITVAFVLPALNLFDLIPAERLLTAMLPVLGLLVFKAVASTWDESADVEIHENWSGQVYDAIASAKKSVVILTSWVVDATTVAERVGTACSNTKRLKVDVFMLDPDHPFGPLRFGEVYQSGKPFNPDWETKYRYHFDHAVEQFKQRLGGEENVELTFLKYPTMPVVKICAIDDSKFFFGWLPAAKVSTKNVCVELSAKSADPGVLSLIEKLREHVATLRMASASFN